MKQKSKVFKDATLGYISVEEKYVANLIDTFEMQRLKDVAQTGIRPIYSGATHDRFSHSLGVYHIGKKIYAAFQNNLEKNLQVCLKGKRKKIKDFNSITEKCKEYYYVACLLHDIGHPAFSHTFEYVYKNKYINLEEVSSEDTVLDKEIDRVAELLKNPEKRKENTLDSRLKKEISSFKPYSLLKQEKINIGVDTRKLESSQSHHEKMGAYQILVSEKLQTCIRKSLGKDETEKNEIDFGFIACMITGLTYDIDRNSNKAIRFEFSLKNCIIRLLNGLIDADSIDYLNRNSHFAGYATSTLDVERLCNAFSAYYDEEREEFVSCFEKSALSAIECFINARNFEPKWLYNHHKIVFYDEYLVKYLYKKCNRYLFAICQKMLVDGIIRRIKDEIASEFGISVERKELLGDIKEKYKNCIKIFSMKSSFLSLKEDDKGFASRSLDEIKQKYVTLLKYIGNPEPIDVKNPKLNDEDTYIVRKYNEYYGILGQINACDEILSFVADAFEEISNAVALGNWEEETSKKVKKSIDSIQNWCRVYGALKDAFLINVFAPVVSFTPGTSVFLKSSDSDISAIFKMMYLRYKDLDYNNLKPSEKEVGVPREFAQFKRALKEFNTRRYRQSLWKSEEEYRLLLKEIAKDIGLSMQVVHDEFLSVISNEKNEREEFEDPDTFLTGLNSNAVYVNSIIKPKKKEEDPFENIFSVFGDGMVIKIYHLKYKDFGNLKINFAYDREEVNIVPYADLGGRLFRKEEYFPYLFFDVKDLSAKEEFQKYYFKDEVVDIAGLRSSLLKGLKKRFSDYLLKRYEKGGDASLVAVNYIRDGKIIRDAVHGDIFVPRKFLKIIDTKAFQRLRRIKQLATADAVFPEATHTRFAHSLGVFHIMSLMVEHFCRLFDYLKISYVELDKEAILAAALLHDIGHGPYSHAFEKISSSSHEKWTSHEEWTRRIVLEDSELNSLLKSEFGDEFPRHVVQYMNYSSGREESNQDSYTLSSVFQSLINSQLDADRLDYLLRDSYNAGVELGSIDLQKIISSLELTEHNGKICVCVNEDVVANIEQIILGRYNMYAKVYHAPYKVFSEELLNKIVERITQIPQLLEQSSILKKVFDGSITVEEYLQMDDFKLYDEIHCCLSGYPDVLLKCMMESFYNRSGYVRLRILDETPSSVNEFLSDLKEKYKLSETENLCGLICPQEEYFAYDCSDDKAILISKRDGSVSDIANESIIFRNEVKKNNNGEPMKLWHFLRKYVYINYEIIGKECGKTNPEFNEDLKKFIDAYDIRRHTEIEEKYSCSEENIIDAKKMLSGEFPEELKPYSCKKGTQCLETKQVDSYYDTEEFLLADRGYSLRCRNKEGQYIFSVKCSIDPNNGKNKGQFVRSEFEQIADADDISEKGNWGFVEKHLSSLLKQHNLECSCSVLKKAVTIKNERNSFLIVRENSDFECEVSLDSIKYIYNDREEQDYQIEIELKSTYHIYKIELKEFAEKLLSALKVNKDENEMESKYRKALSRFGLI